MARSSGWGRYPIVVSIERSSFLVIGEGLPIRPLNSGGFSSQKTNRRLRSLHYRWKPHHNREPDAWAMLITRLRTVSFGCCSMQARSLVSATRNCSTCLRPGVMSPHSRRSWNGTGRWFGGSAERAFWKAVEGIDRQLEEGVEFSFTLGPSWVLLPLVEQIDPTLVPGLFWRAVAARPPIGNPRTLYQRVLTLLR